MRLTKTVFLIYAFFIAAAAVPAEAASDPGIPDTVRVDSVTAFVSGIGVVPLTFFNDEELGYVEVTIRQFSDQIQIDSFSYVGGRLDASTYTREVLINADSNTITIAAFAFSSPISAGSGLLGKLYLSYSQTISPQGVLIDSTTWMVGPIQHSTNLRTFAGSQTFKPRFIPGLLNIVTTPETFDSIWVANVEAAPGAQAAVAIYAYNERNVAQVELALDYGSTDLILDSVSFVGTRCLTAPTKVIQPQLSVHQVYANIEFAAGVPMTPGSGLIAMLHFTIAAEAPDGVISVDSATVGISYLTRFTLTPTDGSEVIRPIFSNGTVTVKATTDVDNNNGDPNLPSDYSLAQNYPNPFNPSTVIELSLPQAGPVEVEVFDILGRRVRTILNRALSAGVHQLVFDGRDDDGSSLATGVYFYRVTASSFHATKKMLLLK